ncbi:MULTISPECIES: YdiU family protein [unclassified Acinetobacter]|uniref:protein adenylyltransferase SelO n=1 Tax=unclassified Acinetobacter TaxID=196816 RepID=UPI0035BB49AD
MIFSNVYNQLDARLFHRQGIDSLPNPQAGHFNTALAEQLQWSDDEQKNWIKIINGEALPSNADPLAMVYAGHQFGHWAGQLGDGRGLLIGQVLDKNQQRIDLHAKGAGKTPYSRMGDGRAVLRSTIREYLAGQALTGLHIASSQAVGFVYSQDLKVWREQLEPTAILLRTSDCHIRFGHFEWINQYQPSLLKDFTQHCLEYYYPDSLNQHNPIIHFAETVVKRYAYLVAQWQLQGFGHGVLNTDNLNITATTLDFGPFAFMERFKPNWIFNHSDHQGRYTYQNQPSIIHWNLWVWLNQLIPLLSEQDDIKATITDILAQFEPAFLNDYQAGLCKKVGLPLHDEGSFQCALDFLKILQIEQLDYCTAFRWLTEQDYTSLHNQCLDLRQCDDFLKQYHAIRDAYSDEKDALLSDMQQHNPIYILRNHMAQRAIELAYQDDLSEVNRLFQILQNPFVTHKLAKDSDLQPVAKGQIEPAISCSS